MKKYLRYILILLAVVTLTSPVIQVKATDMPPYTLLAPLPDPSGGTTSTIDVSGSAGSLGRYLNPMILLFIGLCAVLAVVMIVVGGIEVMTSELAHTKQAGKERIENALLGLLIALGAYALLFTINPDLLVTDTNIPVETAPTAPPPIWQPLYILPASGTTNNIAPIN